MATSTDEKKSQVEEEACFIPGCKVMTKERTFINPLPGITTEVAICDSHNASFKAAQEELEAKALANAAELHIDDSDPLAPFGRCVNCDQPVGTKETLTNADLAMSVPGEEVVISWWVLSSKDTGEKDEKGNAIYVPDGTTVVHKHCMLAYPEMQNCGYTRLSNKVTI